MPSKLLQNSSVVVPTEELYENNKQLQADPSLYTDVLSSREKSMAEDAPMMKPIGDVFAPYGGVKDIDKELSLEDLGDIPEARAQAQGNWSKGLKFFPRVGTKVAAEVAKIPGELYGIGEWASEGFDIKKFEESLNNSWVQAVDEWNENVNDEYLPVYKRKVIEEGGLLRQIVSPEFWATEGADGVGFLISMMAPGVAVKALGAGTKLLKIFKTGSKIGKFVAKNADDFIAGGINTVIEASAEGIEAAKATKNKLLQNKKIELLQSGKYTPEQVDQLANDYIESDEVKTTIGKSGANTTYANMAILLGPNILDQKWLMHGFNHANKTGTRLSKELGKSIQSLGKEGAKEASLYSGKQMTKDALLKVGIGAGKEGFFEEGLQSASSNYFQNRAIGTDDRDVVNGILGTYFEDLSDVDMQKSIFLGAVLGGGMGAVANVRQNKLEKKLLYGDKKKGNVGLIKLFDDNFVNRYKSLSDVYQKDESGKVIPDNEGNPILDAAKAMQWGSDIINDNVNKKLLEVYETTGQVDNFNFAKMVHDFNYMLPFFEQPGGKDMLLQHINDLAEKDSKYMQDTFGLTDSSVSKIKQDLLDKVDVYENIYENTLLNHKAPNIEIEETDIDTFNEFNKGILNTKISNELSQDFTKKKINTLEKNITELESTKDLTSGEKEDLNKYKKQIENYKESLDALQSERKLLNKKSEVEDSWREYKGEISRRKKETIKEAINTAETSEEVTEIANAAEDNPDVAGTVEGQVGKNAGEEVVQTLPKDYKGDEIISEDRYKGTKYSFTDEKSKLKKYLDEKIPELEGADRSVAEDISRSLRAIKNVRMLSTILKMATGNPKLTEVLKSFFRGQDTQQENKYSKEEQEAKKQQEKLVDSSASHKQLEEGDKVEVVKPVDITKSNVDVEAKKADIEKRREEELSDYKPNIKSKDNYNMDEVAKFRKSIDQQFKDGLLTRGQRDDIVSILQGANDASSIRPLHLANTLKIDVAKINARYDAEIIEEVKNGNISINKAKEIIGDRWLGKYDAELAALESTSTPSAQESAAFYVAPNARYFKKSTGELLGYNPNTSMIDQAFVNSSKLDRGTKLSVEIDPTDSFKDSRTEFKNSEFFEEGKIKKSAANQVMIRLVHVDSNGNKRVVGLLSIQDNVKPLRTKIIEAYNNGTLDQIQFEVTKKNKGYLEISKKEEGKPAARNTLKQLKERSGRTPQLGVILRTRETTAYVDVNGKEYKVEIPKNGKLGQRVVIVDTGKGQIAYPLVTRTVAEGANNTYERVSLTKNKEFKSLLDNLLAFEEVKSEEDAAIPLETIHDLIGLPTFRSKDKVVLVPANITEKQLKDLRVAGVDIRKNDKTMTPWGTYAYSIGIPFELLKQVDLAKHAENAAEYQGTPVDKLTGWLGNLQLQLRNSDLNDVNQFDKVNSRTKTDLESLGSVNSTYMIKEISEEVNPLEKANNEGSPTPVSDLNDLFNSNIEKNQELKKEEENAQAANKLGVEDSTINVNDYVKNAKIGDTFLIRHIDEKDSPWTEAKIVDYYGELGIEFYENEEKIDTMRFHLNFHNDETVEIKNLKSKSNIFQKTQELEELPEEDAPAPIAGFKGWGKTSKGKLGEAYKVTTSREGARWLKKMLPNIEHEILDDIIQLQEGLDANVYGRFKSYINRVSDELDYKIQTAKNSKEGTEYHEAFHAVTLLGLNDKQRTKLFDEARRHYDLKVDNELIEEKLADDFRDQMLTGNATIDSWFKKLLYWIKENIFGQPSVEYMFHKINAGKYSNISNKGMNVEVNKAMAVKSKLSPQQVAEMSTMFAQEMTNQIQAEKAKSTDYDGYGEAEFLGKFQIPEGDVSKDVLEFFAKRTYYAFKGLIKQVDPNIESPQAQLLNNALKEFLGMSNGRLAYGATGLKAIRKFADIEGIRIKSGRVTIYDGVDLETDQFEISEEINQLEGWQIDTLSTSGKLGLAQEIRRTLSRIPSVKTNIVGVETYLDFEEVYSTLKGEMTDLTNIDQMIERLDAIKDERPFAQPVIDALNADQKFKTKFFNDFGRTFSDYKAVMQNQFGEYVVYSVNGNTVNSSLISDWKTQFYYKRYLTPDHTVDIEKSKALREKVNSQTNNVDKWKTFFDALDISLDEKTINDLEGVSKTLDDILGYMVKGENPFQKANFLFKKIAKIEANFVPGILESAFRNGKGKLMYAHNPANFLSKQISRFKNNRQELRSFYGTDVYFKNSPLYNQLMQEGTNPTLDNLTYAIFDSTQYKNKNKGTGYSDMSDKQFLSTAINMWYNRGSNFGKSTWFQMPILSDAPNTVFIQLPKMGQSESLDALVKVAKQEYARIQDWRSNKYGVKNYTKRGGEFHYLPFLKDVDVAKAILSGDDAALKTKIKDGLDKGFEEYWKELEKADVFNAEDNLGVASKIVGGNKLLKNNPAQALDKARSVIKTFYYNSVYSTSQIVTLTSVDPSFYKDVTDFYKRNKQNWSPTTMIDTDAEYTLTDAQFEAEYGEGSTLDKTIAVGKEYKGIYIDDVETMGNIATELWNAYEKTGNVFYAEQAANYGYSNSKDGNWATLKDGKRFKSSPVNVADAQTLISPDRFRKIQIGFGRWNPDYQDTFVKLKKGLPLETSDYNIVFQTIKPFYYGHRKIGDKVIPVQNKNSEYMLTKQLADQSPTLAKIYEQMEKNNLDFVSFESVVKAGLQNTVTWEQLQEGNFTTDNIQKLSNSDYGMQQEVPEHYLDSEGLMGSQIRKLILSDINPDATFVLPGFSEPLSKDALVNLYQELIIANLKESYSKLEDRLTDEDGNISNEKLSEVLQEEVISQGLSDELLEAVQLDPVTGNFNVSLFNPIHSSRIERFVNSIFKKNVTKQKIKGGAFVQLSGVGFDQGLDLVTKLDENGKMRLVEVECKLPWSSRKYFEPFMDDNGNIDVQKIKDSGNEDLLKMIGYRIPTEDKYSMLPLKVTGFLPFNGGGSIMLPWEITTIAGSDFDVDKLYVMMPEFKTTNEGRRITKVSYKPELSPEKNSMSARNNMLIDMMYSVLTNSDTFDKFIKPGGFFELQRDANIIYSLSSKGNNKSYSDLTKMSDKELADHVVELDASQQLGIVDPKSQFTMFSRNMGGAPLVGVFANHNSSHAMMQYTNLALTQNIIIGGNTYKALNKVTNGLNERISNNNAQYLAAVVDNAKDPNAFKANINTFTADVVALLSRLGVPRIEIFALVKQPSIVKLTELYYKFGGDFAAQDKAVEEMDKLLETKLAGKNYSGKGDAADITLEEMINAIENPTKGKEFQKVVLNKFLNYMDKAKSLSTLISAMKTETSGAGPLMADNEVTVRKQGKILTDKNLSGVSEIFNGAKYPMFKGFNDYGLIKPNQLLGSLYPMANPDGIVSKGKDYFNSVIKKSDLSVEDINKFNNGLLTYLASNFELFEESQKEEILKDFPQEYKKLWDNGKLDKYDMLKKHIKFVQDERLPFGKIEVNNVGMDEIVKQNISDQWWQLLKDPNLENIGENLIKYSYFKEGYQFGPKTFYHLVPVSYFTELTNGRELNKEWEAMTNDIDLGLDLQDMYDYVDQFIRNNWKNSAYVPVVTDAKSIDTFKMQNNGIPKLRAITKNTSFYTNGKFVNFVKYRKDTLNDKGIITDSEWILYKKVNTKIDKNGLESITDYIPTHKLGVGGQLNEFNLNNPIFKSSVAENNNFFNEVTGPEVVSETGEEFFDDYGTEESYDQGFITDEQLVSETKKDIIDNFEMYQNILEGITKEQIQNMNADQIGEILDKICK